MTKNNCKHHTAAWRKTCTAACCIRPHGETADMLHGVGIGAQRVVLLCVCGRVCVCVCVPSDVKGLLCGAVRLHQTCHSRAQSRNYPSRNNSADRRSSARLKTSAECPHMAPNNASPSAFSARSPIRPRVPAPIAVLPFPNVACYWHRGA